MRQLVFIIALSLGLYAGTLSAGRDTVGVSDVFSQDNVSVGVKVGSASIGDESYTIAGISGNYFVVDNLCVGLGYEKWFSGDPDISKATVESTFYIPINEKFRPYAGLLYRHLFIGRSKSLSRDLDDVDAYGYRIGMAYAEDSMLISAGLVQEKYDTKHVLFNDTETYTEVTIGFIF